jgi:hypothetical protein
MEAAVIDLMMNGGANVAFAGFLLYQFYHQQKKLDERDNKFVEREDSLRARYDAVVQLYIDKEDKMRESVVTELQGIDLQLNNLDSKLDTVRTKVQLLTETVQELKMREIARQQLNKPIAPNGH